MEDAEPIRKWRNEQTSVLRQSKALEEAEQSRYFQEVILKSYGEVSPSMILFGICFDRTLIGYGGLVHLDWENERGEVSFLLDSSLESDGSAKQMLFGKFLEAIKHLSFSHLGLNRIWTETFDFRQEHIAVLERHGFRPEGRLSLHTKIGASNYCDSLIHGCVAQQSREG